MKFKLPKDKKRLFLVSGLMVAVVASTVGGGVYLSNKKEEQKEAPVEQAREEFSSQPDETQANPPVGDGRETQAPQTDQPNSSQQSNTVADDKLADVTLQGVLNNDSISVTLFGRDGVYTVERQVNGAWVSVVNEAKYSGATGLDLNNKFTQQDGLEVTYRVYRTTGGQRSSAKEITVNWNLVVSSGGISSFPGAL